MTLFALFLPNSYSNFAFTNIDTHIKDFDMRLFLALTLLVIFSIPAFAQTEDTILSLPDGHVILNISATERREVEQDLLVANLSYVATNKDARVLQDEINKAMSVALKTAKKVSDVKVNTGSYQVYERQDNRTKEKKWHGQQSLTLKSKNAEKLLKLVGELQDMKLNMNGLSYMLSPETSVEIKDSLMEDALRQLQTRANRAAKALGKSTAELRDVNVNGGSMPQQPRNYARGAMMSMDIAESSMSAPVAASGESTITLTVTARVILKP